MEPKREKASIMNDKLIDVPDKYQSEWVNMPDFVQELQKPFAKIIVRFETEQDLHEFAKLIGQKLTQKTKSIWHPQLIRGKNSNYKYVDAAEISSLCD
jgi:hypothetical protein